MKKFLWVMAIMMCVAGGELAAIVSTAVAAAQEPAVPVSQAPDPAKEIAALKQQVAQLSQPKPMTPAEQTKAAQDGYAMIFKEAKDKAGAACKAVSGRLRVTVASDGKASVSCEM